MDYESNEFLVDGSESFTYDQLSYHDKIKVKALQGLDQLAASLNAISNIKAIEFQINHLNDMTSGFTDQLTDKDNEIASLQTQLNAIDQANAIELSGLQEQLTLQQAAHEAQIAALRDQQVV